MLNHPYTNCSLTRMFNGLEYQYDGEVNTLEHAKSIQEDHNDLGSKTRRIKTQFDTYRIYFREEE